VVEKLSFERNTTVSFFETVIRILGGLAAAHDLSGDAALGDKARDLADRLLPAFDSAPTGADEDWHQKVTHLCFRHMCVTSVKFPAASTIN
jgi:hypothetical protein